MKTKEEVLIKLGEQTKKVDIELLNQRKELINFAVGDAELDKIETIWKNGQSVRATALKEAISKVNVFAKEIADLRVKLFKDKEDFSRKYESLMGESAEKTTQVKDWNNAIRKADAKFDELTAFSKAIQNII